jgi:hypothetical protein
VEGVRVSLDLPTDPPASVAAGATHGPEGGTEAQTADPEAKGGGPPARPQPLRKGSTEIGVMGAYSLSASYLGETPVGKVVRMYWLIPRIGYTFLELPRGHPYLGSFQV